jgi:hypothetical protein
MSIDASNNQPSEAKTNFVQFRVSETARTREKELCAICIVKVQYY